jgi:DNA replicative helicase MCM subunit Mcm2 (Cdc46/Mcm family)
VQFLQFAHKLMARSVMTTGTGTTSAGLTCAAVHDDGGWVLEAGACARARVRRATVSELGVPS